MALTASATLLTASTVTNSPSASATRTTRRIPRLCSSAWHRNVRSINSARFFSLCQSNRRSLCVSLCASAVFRIRNNAPPLAKSLQCELGIFIIGRGALDETPKHSSWPCCNSITNLATSSRSIGGASGNAELKRSVIPSSARKYVSLWGWWGNECWVWETRVG